jgi:hypothetical protein
MSLPTLKRLGSSPVALSNTLTTNIYNPASGVVAFIRHIHIANKTAGPVTFSLWIGATGGNAAGTEWFNAVSIPANSVFDHYCGLKMNNSDFLVGGASAATSLTITIEGEEFLAQS